MEENLEQNQLEQEEELVEEVIKEEPKPEKREMQEYDAIENRLKEIENKIENEGLDMDESLELYEEAVNLGMKASQTVENNVLANLAGDDEPEEEEQSEE